MKEGIHPNYVATKVTCGCGNIFETRSTQTELKVDVCNACHPFYTGKMRQGTRKGRIATFSEKFQKGSYASLQAKKPKKKAKKADS